MVSVIEFHKKIDVDREKGSLIPRTEKVDGEYPGCEMVNLILMLLINTYGDAEKNNQLHSIEDTDGWVILNNIFEKYNNFKKKKDTQLIEYNVLKCLELGYIEITIEDIRYFKITEKCLNITLYKKG
ncbi:hypothetical protein [Viridibacillus arvi]|uniref:hypothetical protein n=1 Tax=Viridibacillus arvi TaxID=263475 RepID=UPI0034CFE02E